MGRFPLWLAKGPPQAKYAHRNEISSCRVQEEEACDQRQRKKKSQVVPKLGGAIRDVREIDVYTPALDFKKILRERSYVSGPPPPKEYLHGIIDMIPRNQIGFHQFGPVYTSEEELHSSLMSVVSGRGAQHDHPTVQRTVYESLKHKPRLARAYMNS